MISSHAAIWWECFTVFWEESLHKHPHSSSCRRSGLSSCVKCCTQAGAPSFKLAEGVGSTRPQWLPSSWPIYSLVCASKYREARLSCNGVVQGWGLLHPRGIFNSHNSHVWAEANPHTASVHCHKKHFVVNNWADIVIDFLIGSYLLLWWLNAQIYHVMLEEKLSEMLEEIPLSVKRNMWVQHNGAPANFAHQVQKHLTSTYNFHWIGQGRTMTWPPRSPDLTPH